jgi:hypothetical protein
MGLRSTRLVARGRMKPTSFWRAMAGAGGQLLDQGRVVIQFGPTAPPNKFFRCSRQQGDIPETSTPVPPPEFLYRTRDRSSLHRREPIEALFLLISE